ncbi:ABC-F family ATP-binding cassette domain-containing protein [Erwinia sp. Leaf53]|uniref:ABC-F family ATP-binding cassette domain-containing protein n=1 Tax=Erwinia sp. Leaf53 TaxID=1736225 RepID=UPI0006F6DC64|nr:ABC-F family ATP-binding cassette domain-containing protein [Erwinia sp. Leaf53]KQN53415.1 ABC transporter [Erwinia sp. Leaf53]
MSTLLSAQALSLDLAGGPLLSDLNFTLNTGDRIGLIGDNGCGKSTLLNLLSGRLAPGRGSLTRAARCVVAQVEQFLPPELARLPLREVLLNGLPGNAEPPQRWQAELLLEQTGFAPPLWQQTAAELSGGQQTRLLLARALIRQPDLLLLDEPGNHLDLPTLLWLEQFLQQWRGSLVMVSHDRQLLDAVTNVSWIVRDRQIVSIALPCTAARTALAEQDDADRHRRQAQQNEIDRVAKSARRLALWGRDYDNEGLARKAKQMEKQVARLQEQQTGVSAGSRWQLRLAGEALAADRLLALEGLTVRAAAAAPVLYQLRHLQVKSSDRIALAGQNGSGKSSLLQQLWQAYQQRPAQVPGITFHPRVRIGYYNQHQQTLRDGHSLIEALAGFAPLSEEQRRRALISAGFGWQRHQQSVSTLSGGERARLLLVGLSLARYSLLLLDEPTNHLDLAGKEELAVVLRDYPGAVIMVSHDRTLMTQSCNRYWLIDGGELTEWHDLAAVNDRLRGEAAAVSSGSATSATSGSALCLSPTAAGEAHMKADSVLSGSLASGKAALSEAGPDGDDPGVALQRESEARMQGLTSLFEANGDVQQVEEQWLEELVTLESRLMADQQRKPHHQKPALQQQWQQRISQLNGLLGIGE